MRVWSVTAIPDAVSKLQGLSEERAALVLAMIENLAELEAREDAEDVAAAREALADGEPSVPWVEAEVRLNAIHGIS